MDKIYALIGGAVVIGLVWLYINHLQNQNEVLTKSNTQLTQAYDNKVSALSECSTSVLDLSQKSDERTIAARQAVDEAKKESQVNYSNSNATLFRKPKSPVLTKDNQKNYGHSDKDKALEDYVQTHDLFNDFIDRRITK